MERVIYVERGVRTAVAVAEDGRLCEYLPEADLSQGLTESIYKGRVERVVPGMQAAFVQLGLERNGFLPLAENSKTVVWPGLQSGQDVLVQVKREPVGQKGAFLTRDVTLAGQYVLLMPMNRYIGVSARVTEEEERQALHALGQEIAQEQFGLVMRQAAAQAQEEDIRQEAEALRLRWSDIARRAPTAHVPSVLERPRNFLERLLDDYLPRGNTSLETNDQRLAEAWASALPCRYAASFRMRDVPGLTKQLERALKRRVWLPSGGNLVIDPCEAMTVVDVNSAKFTGKRALEDTVLRLNLEACEEIAAQIRLRNLSGIILVDFVDMTSEEHREQVAQALRQALEADRVKTVIHGFTSLGLMEVTRKRAGLPLRELMTTPCPACEGLGRVERSERDA